jgi:hypothetical protein
MRRRDSRPGAARGSGRARRADPLRRARVRDRAARTRRAAAEDWRAERAEYNAERGR